MQLPFQHLYNAIHLKLNITLQKNKDKIILLPIGVIPDEEGWDMFTSMYYADSTGYLYVDDSDSKTIQSLQNIKVLDASLGQYISFMTDYLKSIKQEAQELAGITPERQGQVAATTGLGVSQGAVYRSSLMTEDIFAEFDQFQEAEYAGLLELSKFAYRNGKKAQFKSSEGRLIMLDINPDEHMDTDYAIYVQSSFKEKEKLDALKAYGQAFAQNEAKPSMIAEIIDASSSFATLKQKLREMEKMEEQLQQDQSQAERDNQLAIEEMVTAREDRKMELKYYEIDENNLTARQNKILEVEAKLGENVEAPVEGNDNSGIERERMIQDAIIQREKLALDRDKIAAEERRNQRDNQTRLRVAKENRNKHDAKQKSAAKKK
jgi:hypothetical protein